MSRQAQYERRKQAVRLHKRGMTIMDIVAALSMGHVTLRSAISDPPEPTPAPDTWVRTRRVDGSTGAAATVMVLAVLVASSNLGPAAQLYCASQGVGTLGASGLEADTAAHRTA